MSETSEQTAERIAARGREALIARLRPAFEEAAAAHADVLDLSPEQIEDMIQRAADRADGLQWRRALAAVATEELGITLGEALSHPDVIRAHELVEAPSYEDSLAELSTPIRPPAAGTTSATAPAAAEPPGADSDTDSDSDPVADAEPPAPTVSTGAELPATDPAAEGPGEDALAGALPEGPDDNAHADGPLPDLAAGADPEADPEAGADPDAGAHPEAGAATDTEMETGADIDTGADADSGADAATEPGEAALGPGEAALEPGKAALGPGDPEAPLPGLEAPAEPGDDEDDDDHPVTTLDQPTVEYDVDEWEEDEYYEPDGLRMAVIHLGGIANLEPSEEDIELLMSDEGLDIIRSGHDVLGRLDWEHVRALEVPAGRSRRRMRKAAATHLVIRTARGDASFEVPEVTPDELREHLAPVIAEHLHGL